MVQTIKKLNPQELVPTLVDGDVQLTQSMAILSYLDKKFPQPSLVFGTPAQQAQIESMANIVTSDIHPLDNLRVLQYLKNTLQISDEQKSTWYHHWIKLGFNAIEAKIDDAGPYCFGEQVSLADVCLIPQVYNAHRFELDMSAFPKIERVNKACLQLEAFSNAAPKV
jgi:maleylacetoacetate isomerase